MALADLSYFIMAAILSGATLGSLYAVMSVGLSLVYGTIRILNFAHGALIGCGAFVMFYLFFTPSPIPYIGYLGAGTAPSPSLPYYVALPVALLAVFLLGMSIEKGILRKIRLKPGWEMNIIIVTIAITALIENSLNIVFTGRSRSIAPPSDIVFRVGSLTFPFHSLLIMILSISAIAAISLFTTKTRQGIATRAVAQDSEMCTMLGVDIQRIYLYVFAISAALAALTGVLLGSVYLVTPYMGDIPQLKAFIIIVFGGLGSFKGTIYGAFVLGMVESFSAMFLGQTWSVPVMFAFMVAVLIIRPTGLFGLQTR